MAADPWAEFQDAPGAVAAPAPRQAAPTAPANDPWAEFGDAPAAAAAPRPPAANSDPGVYDPTDPKRTPYNPAQADTLRRLQKRIDLTDPNRPLYKGKPILAQRDDSVPTEPGAWYVTLSGELRQVDDPEYNLARQREEALTARSGYGVTDQVFANLGVNDELEGAVAYGAQLGSNVLGRLGGKEPTVSASTAYRAASDVARDNQAGFAADHPVQNVLATVGGIAAAGAPVRAAGVSSSLFPAAAPSVLQTGAQAAAVNAPFAVARQEGNILERLPGAAAESAIAFGGGAAMQAASNGIGRLAASARAKPVTDARALSQEGVSLTPGQMMGGLPKRIEDVMTSLPLTGAGINAARTRGTESFNRVALNRVLAPINESLPRNVRVGRDGVRLAQQKVSEAYNRALDGVTVTPDALITSELDAIAARTYRGAANDEVQTAVAQVRDALASGQVPARTLKELDEELGAAARALPGGPAGRAARRALSEMQDALDDLLGRTSPEALAGKTAADEAFAQLVRIEGAASSLGAKRGVFSPAQLNSSVKAAEGGGRRSARFARQDALMQDLTDPAVQVLPSSVPDSGTALRGMIGFGAYGGLAGGATAAGVPGLAVAGLAADAVGATLYSPVVQRFVNAVYRANSPGAAKQALSRLAARAARDPAFVPAYEEAVRRVGAQLQPSGGRQSEQSARP